jgi:3-dehydroquinate dehydratase-1
VTIRIGKLELGEKPAIALAVGDYEPSVRNQARGTSMLELRVDWFSRQDAVSVADQVAKYRTLGLPLLATIRSRAEGGAWKGSEAGRLKLFAQVCPLVDAVDVELSASSINRQVSAACHKTGKALLVSTHDFKQTPSESKLKEILRRSLALKPTLTKIACAARRKGDMVRLLQFTYQNRQRGLIAISMGPLGTLSRVLGPVTGSVLGYTSMKPALGQLPLKKWLEMTKVLFPEKAGKV